MDGEAHGGRTVLVVDDNPDICATVELMLDYLGYRVLVAHDGEAALALLAGEHVDVVLLDVEMPGMDGRETLARLRPTHPGLPVVLCSGLDRSGELIGAHEPGPTGFLLKPYTFQDLGDAIERALAG